MGMFVNVDSSRLNSAIEERIRFMDRTKAQVAVTSAFFIACRTKQLMTFTSIDRIDTELAVTLEAGITKSGKSISKSKSRQVAVGGFSPVQDDNRMELSKWIVLARMNIANKRGGGVTSRYNLRTNSRYAIPKGAMKKMNRLARENFILQHASSMIRRRHSSTHFLMIGWNDAIRTLNSSPDLVQKYRRGGPPTETTKGNWSPSEKGSAIIELYGDSCIVTIENAIGGEGVNAENFRNALLEHGEPGLQQAIYEEEHSMRDKIAQMSKPGDDAFNRKCA